MTSSSDLPEDVAGFLDVYIESLNTLEVLLTVSRDPPRSWTAAQLGEQLGVADKAIERELDRCVRLGLMIQSPGEDRGYRFAPADPARADAVQRLATCYRSRRVAVINHVASRALKRIQALADAFRLGKKNGP